MKKAFGVMFLVFKIVFLSYGQVDRSESLYVYEFADKAPEPKGGQAAINKWIAKNVNKELLQRTDTINCESFRNGKVMITYIIDEQGKLTQPEVAYRLGEPYDSEALRLIKLMQIEWIPGEKDGNYIKVRTGTAISFCSKLEDTIKRKKRK